MHQCALYGTLNVELGNNRGTNHIFFLFNWQKVRKVMSLSWKLICTDSSYQPPAKKPRANKKHRNSNPKRVPKNEPQDIMDNEFHEELNIENDGESYFAETPFLKSFEPIFTLKDQHGEKLRFICNRCPNMDDSGKFVYFICSNHFFLTAYSFLLFALNVYFKVPVF